MLDSEIIMLIDDDEDDRYFFYEALMQIDKSCQFIAAVNGEIALTMLNQRENKLPHFIFLDLNMPGINGWQILARLRENSALKKIPIIIYTTSQENEKYDEAQKMDAVYFLTKPSRFEDLKNAISCVLNYDWEKIAELNKNTFPV